MSDRLDALEKALGAMADDLESGGDTSSLSPERAALREVRAEFAAAREGAVVATGPVSGVTTGTATPWWSGSMLPSAPEASSIGSPSVLSCVPLRSSWSGLEGEWLIVTTSAFSRRGNWSRPKALWGAATLRDERRAKRIRS